MRSILVALLFLFFSQRASAALFVQTDQQVAETMDRVIGEIGKAHKLAPDTLANVRSAAGTFFYVGPCNGTQANPDKALDAVTWVKSSGSDTDLGQAMLEILGGFTANGFVGLGHDPNPSPAICAFVKKIYEEK